MGGVLKSLLKETIQAFPEGQTIKGSNVEAMLAKKGVKPEELKFAQLGIDPKARYTKEDLVNLEAGRKDVFETKSQPEIQYDWVSLHNDFTNPTYKEKVITFSQPELQPKGLNEQQIAVIETDAERLSALSKTLDEGEPELVQEYQKIFNKYPGTEEAWNDFGVRDLSYDDIFKELMASNKQQGSRYTSGHFPGQDNYLMHNRIYDDTLDGTPTRVLQEIQSDLHQQGRQQGYGTTVVDPDKLQALDDAISEGLDDETITRLAREAGAPPGRDIEDWVVEQNELIDEGLDATSFIPESPYQKTWLRKGIERELVDALNEGRQQLAIPIKGTRVGQKLHRAEGVQKWYETQVLNTAKKVAKASGADFEVKTIYGDTIDAFTEAERKMMTEVLSAMLNTDLKEEVLMHGKSQFASNQYAINLLDNIEQGLLTPADALESLGKAQARDAIEYAIIKPKAGKQVGFSLYSTPVAGAFGVYTALRMGHTEDEIREDLLKRGQDEEEINESLKKAKAIELAVAQGYSEEDIKQYLMNKQPKISGVEDLSVGQAQGILATGTTGWETLFKGTDYQIPESVIEAYKKELPEKFAPYGKVLASKDSALGKQYIEQEIIRKLKTKVDNYKALTNLDEEMTIYDFTAKLKTIAPNMSSITTRTSGFFGDKGDAAIAAQAEYASRQRIIELAKEMNVQLEWYDPRPEETAEANLGLLWEPGTWLVVTPEGDKIPATPQFWSSIKAEKGEIAGAIAGGFIGAKYGTRVPGGPIPKTIGGLGGSILGAGVGAALGSQYDYMSNALELHQNLKAEVAAHRALTAAEASVVGDMIAYPVIKGLGAGWGAIVKAKNYLLAGNKEGARIALRETMMLSDAEVDEMIEQLARVQDIPGTGSDKAIATFVQTQPGGEEIMRVAGALDTAANRNVAKSIDTRAKDLLETTQSLTDENIGKLLREDLANYTTDVKQFYGKVKSEAAMSPHLNKWTFDYAKLAIDPVLDQMQKQITDVPALERFLRKAEIIRARADGRTFADLLDLREMINSFRFGRGNKKATELKTYQELLQRVDSAIEQGSDVVLEQPKRWRDDYQLARMNYAKMKGLEKNVLAKVLNRPGVNQDTIVKALTKYIEDLDGTWSNVMEELPQAAKYKAEGAVINTLAEKYTAGKGMQATNFPALADALDTVSFTSPEARKMKGAIFRLSEVFKNDIPLSQGTGNIIIPKEQSYLTTDPVIRAKFEVASSVFNYVKRLAPTKKGRSLAMIMRAADLLENPLNVKTAKELMEEVGESLNLSPKVLELQRAAANEAAKSTASPMVHLFGSGNTLSLKGSGSATKKIHMSRIASAEDVINVAEAEGISRGNTKALEHALKQRGYQAMVSGTEKVKIL